MSSQPPLSKGSWQGLTLPRTATTIIAAITAFSSIGILLFGAVEQAAVVMGFVPARLSGDLALSPAIPALLTPFSAAIVHGGWFHLAMNLILLVWCGRAVERIIGAGPMVVLYLVGALVSAAAQFLVDPHSLTPMIGASGAISAVIGAFALTFGRQKPLVKSLVLNRWLNVAWLMAAWVVLQWMTGFLMGQQGVLLATAAHIGGFLAGLALIRPLLMWRYRNA